jgi:hypothetical protein
VISERRATLKSVVPCTLSQIQNSKSRPSFLFGANADREPRVYAGFGWYRRDEASSMSSSHAGKTYAPRIAHRFSAVRVSRPAAVIRNMPTSTNLQPARTFSHVTVASPRRTSPAIMLTQNPCAMSHACEAPLRPALASRASARCCSAVRHIATSLAGFLRRPTACSPHYFDRPAPRSYCETTARPGRFSSIRL